MIIKSLPCCSAFIGWEVCWLSKFLQPRRAMVEAAAVVGRRPPSVDAVLSRPRAVVYYQMPFRQFDGSAAKAARLSDFENALQNAIHGGVSPPHNSKKLLAPLMNTGRTSPMRLPTPIKERKLRDRLSLPPQDWMSCVSDLPRHLLHMWVCSSEVIPSKVY